MASSGVPAVPCTSSVESPLIAADRCSETQVFAVPGTPSSSSARSVASVATATSMSRRGPTYFGTITVPSAASPPSRYVTTAAGDSRHPAPGRSPPPRGSWPCAAGHERHELRGELVLGVPALHRLGDGRPVDVDG